MKKLCKKIQEHRNVEVVRSYCIGKTPPGGEKMMVFADCKYKHRKQVCEPEGKSLFLLKCVIPEDIIRSSRRLHKKIMECFDKDDFVLLATSVRAHVVVSVDECDLDMFKSEIHDPLNKCKNSTSIACHVGGTSEAVLCYLPVLKQEEPSYGLQYFLENVSGLEEMNICSVNTQQRHCLRSRISSVLSSAKQHTACGGVAYKKVVRL
ncbi:MAG: DUF3023 domain-containing protein [Ehrlichia sp.]